MNINEKMLTIAIQKSGRLVADALTLLWQLGILENTTSLIVNDSLLSESKSFPMKIVRVRDDDIPALVAAGICDYGIVGMNVLKEKLSESNKVRILQPLAFGFCRLSFAVKDHFVYDSLTSLQGLRIATSYPNLLTTYLKKKRIKAEIVTLSGSIEIAPDIGMADAILDLVATGSTLKKHGLKEVETLLESEAVLIKTNSDPSADIRWVADKFENSVSEVFKND